RRQMVIAPTSQGRRRRWGRNQDRARPVPQLGDGGREPPRQRRAEIAPAPLLVAKQGGAERAVVGAGSTAGYAQTRHTQWVEGRALRAQPMPRDPAAQALARQDEVESSSEHASTLLDDARPRSVYTRSVEDQRPVEASGPVLSVRWSRSESFRA